MPPDRSLAARLWTHLRTLWPRWTLLPAAPFVLWPIFTLFADGPRWEMGLVFVLGATLPYTSAKTKEFFVGAAPALLVVILYDAMRFVKDLGLTPERIHVCDLRDLEVRFFGVTVDGSPATVHDWLRPRATPLLDAALAVPYATFIPVVIALVVFLYVRDRPAMRRFTLGFLVLNVLGFATYHVYPSAPPWYVHAHGCVADLSVQASEGDNLARVDASLGIPYFASFYRRSKDVFGAVPSLHIAYPLLVVLEGWRSFSRALRVLAIEFFLLMCAAAIYLDHHWVLDVVAGILYTTVVFAFVRVVWREPAARALHGRLVTT